LRPNTTLTPGHSYTWSVGAYSSNGAGAAWSKAQTFRLALLNTPNPSSPQGIIPAGNGYDKPTLSWSSVLGADHYYLYVVDSTTGTAVINEPNVTGTSFAPSTALTPGHGYTWYVGAFSSNGVAATWSSAGAFSLAALAPPVPSSPSGAIPAANGYDKPTFRWNSVLGADHYYLYVVDATTGTVVINNPQVAGTSLTPGTALTPGHSYTWYIGAYSSNGAGAAWSSGPSFSLAALAVPAPVGPLGSVAVSRVSDKPTFSWAGVTGADHYYLYVMDAMTGMAVLNNPQVAGTSLTPSTALTPGHNYTWYIGAYSSNGAGNTWSSAQAFSLAALDQPNPSSPRGAISAGTGYDRPAFRWNSVSGAHHYYLYAVDSTTGAAVINEPNVAGTSFTPSTALTPGHSFTWYVGACTTNAAETVWSSAQVFTLAGLARPSPTSPIDAIPAEDGYDRPAFCWNSVLGADHYYLYVVDNTTETAVINEPFLADTAFTPSTALTPGHGYTWYLGAYSTNGAVAAWSNPQAFSLAMLDPPANAGFRNDYGGPTFSWDSVPGADHYYLYVVDSTTGTGVINEPNVIDASFTWNTALTGGHSYTWYVGAYSTNGAVAAWSSAQTLTIPLLEAPTGLGYSLTYYGQLTMYWDPVWEADHYLVSLVDTSTGEVIVDSNTWVYDTMYAVYTLLSPGHWYTWRVAAAAPDNTASWSSDVFVQGPYWW
jgi:hypothetical protein